MTLTQTGRRWAAVALAATGALHLVLAPEYLDEQTYVGVLFILGGIAALALAAFLWTRDNLPALFAGAALAAGMGVGFVLSRTVGLPGFHESEWELSGILSLLLEGVVVVAAAKALVAMGPSRPQRT